MFDCREVHHGTCLKFFKNKVVCCIQGGAPKRYKLVYKPH